VRSRAFEGATWGTARTCTQCGDVFELGNLKAILSDFTARQLEINTRAEDIWKADLGAGESYFNCPGCATYWIAEGAESECPDCGTRVCQRCWQSLGECTCATDVPCLAEAQSAAVIRRCPRCRTPFIKDDDNCNHVTCTRCGTEICYYCGSLYTGTDIYSEHFGEREDGKCPMYASQQELHEDRALKAEEEFQQRTGA
jgi:transcription elongation factor Elf1